MNSLIIAGITAVVFIVTVLVKPYVRIGRFKIGLYVPVCFLGAAAELLFGGLTFSDVFHGITAAGAVNPVKILVLFISVTLISVYLGDAGFFDYVAERVFTGARGGFFLFAGLYAVVSVLTVFTSNDIVILTFTPPVCIFCAKAKISPVPYLLGEFIGANTWSMALVVGNPTNVYLAESAGLTFFGYFSVMWLPAVVAGSSAFITLTLLFRKSLFSKPQTTEMPRKKTAMRKVPLIACLCSLIGCVIALALSDAFGVEMWAVALGFALFTAAFVLVYGLFAGEGLSRALAGIKKAPWELVPFVLSMFVIVLALAKSGVTGELSRALVSENGTDALKFGFLSAGLSNALNNIPASVLLEKIIAGKSVYATFGAVIGCNIGAFVTPVGALAGIMWNKILDGYGVKFSFFRFAGYGTTVAVITLALSCASLFLVL